MDPWQSTNTEGPGDGDSEVIEIIPMDEYDTFKAKAKASLSWILCKAYQDKVPAEFIDPFYDKTEGSWQIKPRLANLLASSELYCQACRTMFGENASQWKGHWSIIQVLSRKGIYSGSDSVDVTETILMQSAPFKLKAHLALIDALMTAFSREIMSIERVTQTVRRFASFNASSELPSDTEDAILFWVNKVCVTVQRKLETSHDTVIEGETNQKVRIVSSKTQESISVPVMESLTEDMGDGCSLATLLSFYCPQILKTEDVCLKSNVGIADSLYNLRLIRSFCVQHLPNKTWHFNYEDLLYTYNTVKLNIMVMIAELFYWFEIKHLPIVTGAGLGQSADLANEFRPIAQTNDYPGSSNFPRESVVAWPEKSGQNRRQLQDTEQSHASSNLLANVSIDSDMNASFSSGSIDLGDLDNSPRVNTDRSQPNTAASQNENVIQFSLSKKGGTPFPQKQNTPFPDHSVELQSVNSGVDSRFSNDEESLSRGDNLHESAFQSPRGENSEYYSSKGDNLEPLIPARLKPAKEKINNHTKEEERGEIPKRKTPSPPKTKKTVQIDPHLAVINRSEVLESSETITPLPGESSGNFYEQSDRTKLGQGQSVVTSQPGDSSKKFEAFFIRGSVSDSEEIHTARSDATVAESYVIDQISTPEAARAAGIPIIDEYNLTPTRRLSREGSVASSKSSGDYSDHESHKIHIDHKAQESINKMNNNNDMRRVNENDFSDPSRFILQKPVIVSKLNRDGDKPKGNAINFAQIKQMKQFGHVDNSGLIYMQHGQEEERKPSSLKDNFQKKQQEKKTTFNTLPSQRTWQNINVESNSQAEASPNDISTANESTSQEFLKIRMKLEEKRKAIERKKHSQEIQQQKIRQRLGKAAFLHVVAKPKDDSSAVTTHETIRENPPARMVTSDPELPLATSSDSRISSASSSPMRSPSTSNHNKASRAVSRDDLQQTIENVRKKWFTEDDMVAPRIPNQSDSPETIQNGMTRDDSLNESEFRNEEYASRRPVFDRRSASAERVVSLADQGQPEVRGYGDDGARQNINRRSISADRQPVTSLMQQNQLEGVIQDGMCRRSLSIERESREGSRNQSESPANRTESYDQYNNSLDKLNQSLTDLQGEIMKLSLKQRKPENAAENVQSSQRSRSKSPPRDLEVREKNTPERSKTATDNESALSHSKGQGRSASEPRQVAPEYNDEQIGNYMSQTLPRPQGYGSPYVLQNQVTMAGPTGPVYGTPSNFMAGPNQGGIPPTAQQYGSYIMGPGTQQPMVPMHQQMAGPYQHSPPQVFGGSPGMYPGQHYPQQMVSPQNQPYTNIYASPTHTQFQTLPHMAGTYTTSAHQPVAFTPPGTHGMPFDAGNQFVHQMPLAGTQPPNSQQSVPKEESRNLNDIQSDMRNNENANKASDKVIKQSIDKTGKNSDIVSSDNNEFGSSVIADFAQKFEERNTPPRESKDTSVRRSRSESRSSSESKGRSASLGATQDTAAVGYVIGHDETSLDQTAEEEMLKKKEKIEKMRLKRQEEQERKRQKIEQEMNRKREAERAKQEEAERRKLEEKARREQIFKQYLEKKEEDEDGPKREKPKQKSRPKSMFVKVGPGADLGDGVEACSSNEDLSARSSNVSAGANNSAYFFTLPRSRPNHNSMTMSLHTLNQHNGSGEGRNLAYGGLTHRRPPSPDLYRIRKGQRSAESSEAGSAHGSDYSGPKLFVKPSAKSNRHIIINAISHCCLAGSVNTEQKNKVLEEVAKSSAKHFIILFRDASCGYRGLYGFDPDSEDCFKIVGVGPRSIQHDMVEKYFKYNSGGKSFSELSSTKHLSVSIDAVALQNAVWKPSKAPAKGFR
ncbi:hypothetical protein ACF0H5_022881 [Mactra antiquata]